MNRKNLTAAVLAGVLAIAFFFSTAVPAQEAEGFPTCLSGSWYNPDKIGEGMSLEVVAPDLVVGYFYTFYNNENKWYTMVFEGDGMGEVYTSAKDRTEVRWVGNATLDMFETNTIVVVIDLDFDFHRMEEPDVAIPWCIGCVEELLYTRLTSIVPCE